MTSEVHGSSELRIPVCRVCSDGLLKLDEAGWHCAACGLVYKFPSRYKDEADVARAESSRALAAAQRTFELLTEKSKGLDARQSSLLEFLSCETCQNALDPKHISFGMECHTHRKPPTG